MTTMTTPEAAASATENPYTAWNELAAKTAEMMTASAHVISHRSMRMAMAGPIPNQIDQAEFSLMGKEKIDALSESANAMTLRMMGLHQQIAKLTLQQLLLGTKELIAVALSAFVKPATLGRGKLVYHQMTNSTEAISQLNASLADVAQIGLEPLHARATANAIRLAKL
ncbi:polyhydroxyalkanoate granule-associated phasin [Glaciimonas sp. PCH181]|uniref:polyhydroxyalkanoate granule-associated phasin n=1 Tax=Glaciimonas sp. PCH181 TaxID=2133943 RepID=UPI000D3D5B5F|nr:polyhydroxyalkanoate granule-associated phasin [Glaciimonas sp. PCH181]PUA19783.1 hypothetical protein C7W93_08155 [Glaciimonas sp. PCH181]